MGAVLEMKQMIRFIVVPLAMAVASCGAIAGNPMVATVVGTVAGVDASEQATQPISVSREELLANPGTYMRVNIRDRDRWDTMVKVGENGARTTWIDGESITLTEENGVVAATRGLPRDIMGADTAPTWNAIRAGGGELQRRVDFLDDQDQILSRVLQCRIVSEGSDPVNRLDLSYPATRFREECSSDGLSLANIYWVNPSGRIIRSVQAISPDAGYLQIDVF